MPGWLRLEKLCNCDEKINVYDVYVVIIQYLNTLFLFFLLSIIIVSTRVLLIYTADAYFICILIIPKLQSDNPFET